MKTTFALLILIILSSCQHIPYMGSSAKVSHSFGTKLTKAESYKRTKVWLVKELNNPNSSIVHEDKENGTIISKIYIPCDAGRSVPINGGWFVSANMTVKSDNNGAAVSFSEILQKHPGYALNKSAAFIAHDGDDRYPKNELQLNEIDQECLIKIIDDLKNTLGA